MKLRSAGEKGMNNESRIVRVETVIEHIQYMLDRIDKRFDKADENMVALRKDITQTAMRTDDNLIDIRKEMKEGFSKVESKIDANFKWVVGSIITLFVLNGFVPAIIKVVTNLITK